MKKCFESVCTYMPTTYKDTGCKTLFCQELTKTSAAARPNSSSIQFVIISFTGKFKNGIKNLSVFIRFHAELDGIVSGLKENKSGFWSVRNWIQSQLPHFQSCPIVSRITKFEFPCIGRRFAKLDCRTVRSGRSLPQLEKKHGLDCLVVYHKQRRVVHTIFRMLRRAPCSDTFSSTWFLSPSSLRAFISWLKAINPGEIDISRKPYQWGIQWVCLKVLILNFCYYKYCNQIKLSNLLCTKQVKLRFYKCIPQPI